jgi:hypothetical protein
VLLWAAWRRVLVFCVAAACRRCFLFSSLCAAPQPGGVSPLPCVAYASLYRLRQRINLHAERYPHAAACGFDLFGCDMGYTRPVSSVFISFACRTVSVLILHGAAFLGRVSVMIVTLFFVFTNSEIRRKITRRFCAVPLT